MREVLRLASAAALPSRAALLGELGLPGDAALSAPVRRQLEEAEMLYRDLAAPVGLFEEIGQEDFAGVFRGEGLNEVGTPVEPVVAGADRLALFAATLGEGLSARISELFAANEPALAFLLDALASLRADASAELLAGEFRDRLIALEGLAPTTAVLPYSPGYCGWHITGQRRLFAELGPGEIGITLNESCLMTPLKSVSGVLVAGAAAIHDVEGDSELCDRCATHHCRERLAALLRRQVPGSGGGGEEWTS